MFAYDYHYEQIPDESEILRPTTVECMGFARRREINGLERREHVENEFADRRRVVLSMLAEYSGRVEPWMNRL